MFTAKNAQLLWCRAFQILIIGNNNLFVESSQMVSLGANSLNYCLKWYQGSTLDVSVVNIRIFQKLWFRDPHSLSNPLLPVSTPLLFNPNSEAPTGLFWNFFCPHGTSKVDHYNQLN